MEKLKLEHLAPYLPYGAMFQSSMDKPFDEFGKQPIWHIEGIIKLFGNYCLITKNNNDAYEIATCRLVLRPLSDLTKEIGHNGERFVPIDFINGEFASKIPSKIEWNQSVKNQKLHFVLTEWVSPEYLYGLFELLFKWHFDIFGLIEKGLAIDINITK